MYNPPTRVIEKTYIKSLNEYEQLYQQSVETPKKFWSEQAEKYITWIQPFTQVQYGGFENGDIAWFMNGKLNASANCVDRHLPEKKDQIAIIWESDEQGVNKKITFQQLFQEMCKIANFMKQKGIKKGDTVTIYMPMIPELIYTILACTRIGAIHNVVFAGFSSTALKDRIIDAESKYVFTADYGRRGGKTSLTKNIVDVAIKDLHIVQYCFVFRHPTISTSYIIPEISWNERDIDMSVHLPFCRPYCPYEMMDSEDPLFILYTSGSTGKPKGLIHTTAGYLLYTIVTSKYVFDLQPDDVYACVADAGWITGHSYVIYGPLGLGNSTIMFESIPSYPDYGRYWDLIQKYRITQFYTAPTAIRSLMGQSKDYVTKYDLSSLRVLGSVGEPINPEAWKWYYEVVGKKQCAIVDTYWQTETGGHVGTNLPGCIPMKPGSCSFPFFGIEFLLKNEKGEIITEPDVEGRLCIAQPWPGIARTVNKDHRRYLDVYMKSFPGTYFTGDACKRDKDGFYWIIGRIDDVLNTSGHRIGTAEIESALVSHECVSEAAVVGFPHAIRGEGICCFVTLRAGIEESPALKKDLALQVARIIGPFARPDVVVCTPNLPKTRSGKIMRRILRKIAWGEESSIGDISTLADPAAVDEVLNLFKNEIKDKNL